MWRRSEIQALAVHFACHRNLLSHCTCLYWLHLHPAQVAPVSMGRPFNKWSAIQTSSVKKWCVSASCDFVWGWLENHWTRVCDIRHLPNFAMRSMHEHGGRQNRQDLNEKREGFAVHPSLVILLLLMSEGFFYHSIMDKLRKVIHFDIQYLQII